MSSGEILNVEPLELRFPFELKKQISCSVQVSNKTENYVAFKVKTTNPKKYCVRPNTGIVLPRSTCDIVDRKEVPYSEQALEDREVAIIGAQKEAPTELQCKDKFLLQSVVASPGATPKEFSPEMFNAEPGRVIEECKLKVVYLSPPQPPFPVAEGSEEGGSSPKTTTGENGTAISRLFVDSHDKSPEIRSLISKLTEEKSAAIQRNYKLRQELEVLIRERCKNGGGISVVFVIVIGFLGIILGYLIYRA